MIMNSRRGAVAYGFGVGKILAERERWGAGNGGSVRTQDQIFQP